MGLNRKSNDVILLLLHFPLLYSMDGNGNNAIIPLGNGHNPNHVVIQIPRNLSEERIPLLGKEQENIPIFQKKIFPCAFLTCFCSSVLGISSSLALVETQGKHLPEFVHTLLVATAISSSVIKLCCCALIPKTSHEI